MLVDGVGEQAPLIKPDISRGCANQTRNSVAFHVLRHVKAQQLEAHLQCKLPGELGFTHARRTGQQERAYRFLTASQPCSRQLDSPDHLRHGIILPEDGHLEVTLELA